MTIVLKLSLADSASRKDEYLVLASIMLICIVRARGESNTLEEFAGDVDACMIYVSTWEESRRPAEGLHCAPCCSNAHSLGDAIYQIGITRRILILISQYKRQISNFLVHNLFHEIVLSWNLMVWREKTKKAHVKTMYIYWAESEWHGVCRCTINTVEKVYKFIE